MMKDTMIGGAGPCFVSTVSTEASGRHSRALSTCKLAPLIGTAKQSIAAGAMWLLLAGRFPAPPEGNCPECLGAVDGLLADCPERTRSCVSSQDDSPLHFQEPWEYEESQPRALRRLKALVEAEPGSTIIKSTDDYLRVEFSDAFGNVDDTEFLFTAQDNTIQFRSNRRGGSFDFFANASRMEKIRTRLGYTKLPILRNRRRAFLFFESPVDEFGPTTSKNMDVRSAEDGPGERFDMDPLAPAPEPLKNKYGSRK